MATVKSCTCHGGHNPSKKIACGAVGFLDESKEDRLINKEVIRLLKKYGVTTYDCTVNNGTSQSDVLRKIVKKCNSHATNLDISFHFNSGRNDKKGDKKIGGVEVWLKTNSGIRKEVANRILKNMGALGFTVRGIKRTDGLYFLNHTDSAAILVEVTFVDDKDDYKLYNKLGYKTVAKAIAEGILNKKITESSTTVSPSNSKSFKEGEYNKTVKTTTTLNVREKRNASSEKLGTLPKGTEVKVLYILEGKDGNLWGSIDFGKTIGMISLKFTTPVN